jgi:NADPH:quinone reductase-like Zn-dependent oxidoreductase
MKAVVMDRYGTPDVLRLRDVPVPEPKAGEVLVRVHAASINDWDWLLLRGTAPIVRALNGFFVPKTKILGGDIAGTIEGVGEGVKTLRSGDEVYGDLIRSGLGAFAEYACAPESCLERKPRGMTFEQAAAVPQAGMLALQGLVDVGRIRSGQKILLNGAGGGVGTFALQIARLYGVEITAVDKASKLDMLRAMGADHVVDYAIEDFTRKAERYDLILDVKTDRSPSGYVRVLNREGVYATVGGHTARLLQALVVGPVMSLAFNKQLRVVALRPNAGLAFMNEVFEAGKLVPVIGTTFPLADLAEAFRLFGTGDHRGKIVISIA